MSKIWLAFIEQREGKIKKASLEALTLAKNLATQAGGTVHAALIGDSVQGLSSEIAGYGAEKIFLAESPDLALYSGDAYSKALAQAAKDSGAEVVIASHTAMGKDLLPRVASLLEAGMVSDATQVELQGEDLIATKPVYAGKAYKTLKVSGQPFCLTLRPNTLPPQESAGEGTIVTVEAPAKPFLDWVKEILAASTDKTPLQEAAIVVSGGRGLKDPENWKLVEGLAEAFGPGVAAVGASRAVVDAGWRPHSEQVGQTGKVVSPTLYIALGISGAIQHLAGMSTSKYIVAINKDPDAPIFKVANYGIVGDVLEVVPSLIEAIKAAREA
ncbi:MAG TPA: electron transfer flavoprotein subunit alpha/FixB family protein [Planctomycetes bacterium]|nr:electron transfer flavoprotein subunit alpha/FixB family protein [Planctomycetota bacterium]